MAKTTTKKKAAPARQRQVNTLSRFLTRQRTALDSKFAEAQTRILHALTALDAIECDLGNSYLATSEHAALVAKAKTLAELLEGGVACTLGKFHHDIYVGKDGPGIYRRGTTEGDYLYNASVPNRQRALFTGNGITLQEE